MEACHGSQEITFGADMVTDHGISGGGITGYLKPDVPLIGPMITKLTAKGESVAQNSETLSRTPQTACLASSSKRTVSGRLA